MPGVRDVAPYLEARGNVVGPDGRRSVLLVGGDPRLARIGGTFLRRFTDDELSRQRSRTRCRSRSPTGDRRAHLRARRDRERRRARRRSASVAELQREDFGTLVFSPIVLMPMALAQEVLGMTGWYTRIVVEARARARRRGARRAETDRRRPAERLARELRRRGLQTRRIPDEPVDGDVLRLLRARRLPVRRHGGAADGRRSGDASSPTCASPATSHGCRSRCCCSTRSCWASSARRGGLACSAIELSRAPVRDTTPGYLAFAFPIGTQRIVDLADRRCRGGRRASSRPASPCWRRCATSSRDTSRSQSSDSSRWNSTVAIAAGACLLDRRRR